MFDRVIHMNVIGGIMIRTTTLDGTNYRARQRRCKDEQHWCG